MPESLTVSRADFSETESRYQTIINNISNGVIIFQPVGNDFIVIDINPSGEKIYRKSKEKIIGRLVTEVFPNIRDYGLFDAIRKVRETGESVCHPDIYYEGEQLIGWRKHFIFNLKTEEIASIFSDDTQQKLTELALVDFESRYRALFNNANDAIMVNDFDGRIIDVNQGACELLGYSREHLEQMNLSEIVQQFPSLLTEQHSPIAKKGGYVCETAYRRSDGELIPVEVSSRIVEYDQKQTMMTLARDIRERRRAESEKSDLMAQLRQSQKMEAIGTLAGGIAHDFNNILHILMGYADLAMLHTGDNQSLQEHLTKLQEAGYRARDLIQHILTFSRQTEHQNSPVRMQFIIKETLKLLRATLPANIQIREKINKKCGYVLGDPTQIHQVIMNLCTNSYQAMTGDGGVLEVQMTEVDIGKEDALFNLLSKPGRYLQLSVSDTGCGMDHSVRERIFDPYFTTKKKGKGTGLGLAIVHGIVKSMEGHITVYSEPGVGTTFHIYLPRIEGKDNEIRRIEKEPVLKGNEHILLVDDEESIIRMEQNMLSSLGYEISARTGSLEAYELFCQAPDRFAIVITDMSMPNMSGAKLSEKILAIRPDIPIILLTGFSEVVSAEKALTIGIKKYLMKPVRMRDLAAAIRELLDQRADDNRKN